MTENMKKRARLSLVGCCMAIFWSGSMAFGFPGVMGTYWQEEFQASAAQTGLIVSIMLLALAVCMFVSGKVHLKIGTKKCILLGTAVEIFAMLTVTFASNMLMVYIWAFSINVGTSFIYGPGLTTTQQWFPHKRGLISGITNLTFGVSAAIMSPIWTHMLAGLGYRRLCLTTLVLMVITNIVAVLMAEVPEKSAMSETEKQEFRVWVSSVVAADPTAGKKEFTVSQAIKTKSFWLLWLTWVFMGAAGISMISLSKTYAAAVAVSGVAVLTSFNLTNGIGRIFAGMLTDKIGGEATGILAFSVAAVGYILLPVGAWAGLGLIAVGAACVGFGFGTLFTVTSPIATKRFGLKFFGMIYGVIFTAYGFIGGFVGPALAGAILDHTGNYLIVFLYLAVFAAIGAVLMGLLKKCRY